MRLAIMSFAHLHAEAYINNLRNALDVEFVGFSDLDAERGKHFAGVFKTKWYDSHEDLLKEGLDGVVICSENARHRELVEMAAGAGVPILCEKPIEVTLEDARAMRDVCKANNVTFMTAFPVRFSSSVQQVKNALDRGDLGVFMRLMVSIIVKFRVSIERGLPKKHWQGAAQ
ncbi:MAG: Gfo/Idh/MocA family oxidoreductase [Anaerolineae bacterium]|nr:Gfo/Idh/MocA family oxidoreductase [Anaerolineae bacterium]